MSSKIIASTTSGTALNMSADTSGILEIQTGSTPTTAITVDASQNVGVGTTPSAWGSSKAIQINGSTAIWNFAGTNSYFSNNEYYNGTNRIFIANGYASEYTQAAGTHSWFTSNASGTAGNTATMTQVLGLDTSGNLLINTTSQFSSGKICATYDGTVYNGIVLKTTNATLNSNYLAFYNSVGGGTGSVVQNGTNSVAYGTSSDYRLKEDIAPMTGALAKVAALKPVTYKWKTDGSAGQGFIAHELQEVVPDCVTGEKDAVEIVDDIDAEGKIIGTKEMPKYQGIDTSFLVATLTAAIQELNAKVTALEAQLGAK